MPQASPPPARDETTSTLTLGPRLDLTAARGLAADLRARRAAPLVIDASGVEVLGGLCLQLLLAAQQTWSRAGLPLRLGSRSPAFDRALAQFGITLGQLECGGRA